MILKKGSCFVFPSNNFKPIVFSISGEDSENNCIPKHIPKMSLPFLIIDFKSFKIEFFFIFSIALGNVPTPGSIITSDFLNFFFELPISTLLLNLFIVL